MLSSKQRETLSAWLSSHDRDFAIDLTQVIAGDKPATELRMSEFALTDGPFLFPDRAAAFLRELELVTEERGDSQYVARSNDWFDLLPSSGTLSDTEHERQRGIFFGYPERDIEWFINTHDERISPRKRVKNDDFTPEEIAYIDFLSYVNEDSVEGYERAIENGKHVRKLLSDVANKWGIPGIKEIATDHHQSAVDVYSGERDPGEFEFRMITKNPEID